MTTIQLVQKSALLSLVLVLLSMSSMNAQVKVDANGSLVIGYEAQSPNPGLILGIPSTNYPMGKWLLGIENTTNALHIRSGYRYDSGYKFYFEESGRLGLRKIPVAGAVLDVAGSIAVNGTIVYSSDERLKRDIKPIAGLVPNLYSLEGKSYIKFLPEEYASKEDPEFFLEYGFLAQELQKHFPDLVEENSDGYLTINYISLIPIVVEALKQQKQEIEELKASILTNQLRSSSSTEETTAIQSVFKDVSAESKLYQNAPNPFTENTEIRFSLPESAKQAYICIFDLQGTMLKKSANLVGQSNLLIHGKEFKAGMYLYSLIVDGKEVDTKRMILTK